MRLELNEEAERIIRETLSKGQYRSAEDVVLAGLKRMRMQGRSTPMDDRVSQYETVSMDYIVSQMHDDAIHGRDRMRACGANND